MELLNLDLLNFRNFSSKKIQFSPKLTVIIGDNGTGKSNILEAVLLLSGVRPSKVQTDRDLIRFGENEAKVEGKVKNEEVVTLTINLQDQGGTIRKSFFGDSLRKRLVDFIAHLSVVIFHPEDLNLVSGSPSIRRHHLDSLLANIDSEYFRSLSAYTKVVTRRNKVLSRIFEGKAKKSELDFWDERLLEHGSYISKKRRELFEFLNFVEPSLAHVNGGKHPFGKDLSWELKQSIVTEEKLFSNRERDIAAGVTLSGPHRDDFRFQFQKRDLEFFGSRGEQRMAVLALKLSELEFYSVQRGVRPILALDDIFSELDWEHRETVLEVIGNQQTIITAAEVESVPKELLDKAKIIQLK